MDKKEIIILDEGIDYDYILCCGISFLPLGR